MKVVTFAMVLWTGVCAVSCPVFSCRQLDAGRCAVMNSSSAVVLNSARCDATLQCTATGVLQWFFTRLIPPPGSFYNCTAPTPNTELPVNWDTSLWQCPSRGTVTLLKEGTYPKRCEVDDDCVENDGAVRNNSCTCSVDSQSSLGFCKPSLSSTTFEDYWTACGQNGYIEGSLGLYWFLYTNYYTLYQGSGVSCLSNMWEMEALQQAKVAVKAAGRLLAAAAVGVAVAVL